MKNPGLGAFAYIKSPNHPLNIDPLLDDPDLESGDNDSDFVRGHDFGRWKNPGSSIKVPFHSPEGKTFYGEIVGPADHDSADRIFAGEHDFTARSENPYVERAREDLHTPEAQDAVHTISGLLSGQSPQDVGGVDEAHDYLSHHFTNVKVNPLRGTLFARSPGGLQMARRKSAVDQPDKTYELINRHGQFETKDPRQLVRTMVAFQIVHNQLAHEEERKKKHHHTSASLGDLAWAAGHLIGKGVDAIKGLRPTPAPPVQWPQGAVFEPGRGLDKGPDGDKQGGYVMSAEDAPPDWWRMGDTAFSPGHHMRLMLDPKESVVPRPDTRFPGHTFTYAPNPATGHISARHFNGVNYFVRKNVHPAARGAGFDHIRVPGRPTRAPRPPAKPKNPSPLPPASSAVKTNLNDLCPVCASGYLESYSPEYHECLNCGSLVQHIGFEKEAARKPGERLLGPRGPLGRGLSDIPQSDSDPLNLSSGGSEGRGVDSDPPEEGYHPLAGQQPDEEFEAYEAPLRGQLLSSVLKQAKQINELTGWPMADQGPDGEVRCPECGSDDLFDRSYRMYRHEPDMGCNNCAERFHTTKFAPTEDWEMGADATGGYLAKTKAAKTEPTVDPLDEQLGKQGFFPIHKPGQQSQRAYVHEVPGLSGSYFRLTEGAANHKGEPTGWLLTADHLPNREQYTQNGEPYRNRNIKVDRLTNNPGTSQFAIPLRDPGERVMGEKSFLAEGSHPIDDDVLNRAIRDVHRHGRNSETYRNAVGSLAYEPPQATRPTPGAPQRDMRMLSSVSNPGRSRFAEV